MAPLSNGDSTIDNRFRLLLVESAAFILVGAILMSSLLAVVVLCACGGKNEDEAEGTKKPKKGKKGKKAAAAAAVEATEPEEQENEEEEQEEEQEEEKEETQVGTVKKKTTSAKPVKKGGKKKAAKKKAVKPVVEAVEASAIQQSAVQQSAINMDNTRAPTVMTTKTKPKQARPKAKRGDPLYKTMMAANSQVFDKTTTKKHTDTGDACYIMMGDGKTRSGGPCGGGATTVAVDGGTTMDDPVAERTEIGGGQTMAKARSNIFDAKAQSVFNQTKTMGTTKK